MPPRIPDISVVVPIYNVEQYLRECVDSILAQTHKNIEVILVNDGSTDKSLKIIREYEKSDPRVVVIDKPNGGYGHSVNCGIDAAKGTWLSIIEPDDIIDTQMYADLLANATLHDGAPADIVKSSYWLYYDHEDGSAPYTDAPNLMKYMPTDRCILEGESLREFLFHHPSIWSAIYRRDFIEDCHIRMIQPKGAGWADNPWFLDTILRAKSIVWWPRAYYYYRQTNPNASSKSPSPELPFDRLRDMRKIISNTGLEADENVVIPFYNRSFCYILDSILDEYGYPENDPKVYKNIREVLESMDERTVLGAHFGITEEQKSYYKDVMGIHLKELQEHTKPTQPLVSIVLAMNNDKQELWRTVHSLTGQHFRNFEVICVDTGSQNRFADIVQDISKIDGRFSLIQLGKKASIGDAFNAGIKAAKGKYVQFWRPGVTYPYRTDLEHIVEQVRIKKTFVTPTAAWNEKTNSLLPQTPFGTRLSDPDIVAMTENLLTDFLPEGADAFNEAKVVSFNPKGVRGKLANTGGLYVYNKLFSHDFLTNRALSFDPNDNEGYAFSVTTIDRANTVVVVRGGSPDAQPVLNLVLNSLGNFKESPKESSKELISLEKNRISPLANTADSLDDKSSAYIVLLEEFKNTREFLFSEHSDDKYFTEMATLFGKAFRKADLSILDNDRLEQYELLQRSFSGDYTSFLQKELAAARAGLIHIEPQVDRETEMELARVKRELASVRNSTSFRLGRILSNLANKLLPKSLVRKIARKIR